MTSPPTRLIAVVDIDGVLADASHREPFLAGRPKNWDAFFAAVGADAPIAEGISLARELARAHDLVLLSGRPERTRADTVGWLTAHEIGYERLLLRPDDDHRPARSFKAGVLRRLGPPTRIAVVVDDDEAVVEEATRRGYPSMLFPPPSAR